MNTKQSKIQPHVRWMLTRRDMPEVMAIDEASYPKAWSEAEFRRLVNARNVISMVAEHDGAVVGDMIYELKRDSILVVHFAVAPTHRRRGVGTAMAAKLASKLSPDRRRRVHTAVRDANVAGQLFLKAIRWRAYYIERDGFEPGVDAYAFELSVAETVEPRRPSMLQPSFGGKKRF